jgi:hypothetical protein
MHRSTFPRIPARFVLFANLSERKWAGTFQRRLLQTSHGISRGGRKKSRT